MEQRPDGELHHMELDQLEEDDCCMFIKRKRAQLINLILIKYKEAANCKTWMFHTSSAPRHGELYQSPVSRWTLKMSVSNLCNHI